MGRKTFDSIGKLLPQRFNIILSRSKSKFISEQNNYSICRNIEDAYSCANEKKNGDLYVIGGQEVFNQTINSADELIISHIPLQVKGDAFFPAIDTKIWNEDKRISQDSFHISYYSKRN